MDKICLWFTDGEGTCFKNGSRCDYPFSDEGCKIQCEELNKLSKYPSKFKESAFHRYKPYDKDVPVRTITDIYKYLKIKKGDLIADYRIPFYLLHAFPYPSAAIDNAWEQIERKLKDAGLRQAQYTTDGDWIFYNVELMDGVTGIYLISVRRE